MSVADTGRFAKAAARKLKRLISNGLGESSNGSGDFSDYHYHRKSFFEELGRQSELVFVGDSITCNADWHEIFPGSDVTNRGVISDRIDGVLHRIDSILATKARTAFVMIGFNDIHQGRSAIDAFGYYEKLVRILTENRMRVFVQSTLFAGAQYSDLNQAIGELNGRLQVMCEQMDDVVYLDLNQALAIDGVLNSEYSRDGVHLNGRGYVAWRDAIQHLVVGTNGSAPVPSVDR